MNTKDFIRLGVPLGEATRRATDFISKFILAGGDKTRLEEEVKAIVANLRRFALAQRQPRHGCRRVRSLQQARLQPVSRPAERVEASGLVVAGFPGRTGILGGDGVDGPLRRRDLAMLCFPVLCPTLEGRSQDSSPPGPGWI